MPEVSDCIFELHPNYGNPPKHNPETVPLPPNVAAHDKILRKLTTKQKSIDAYGFDGAFYRPLLNTKATKKYPSPISILATYADLLTSSSLVSRGVSFLSTLGVMSVYPTK